MKRFLFPGVFALCLAGCFVFNNPYDTTPAATFQIVITSTNYGGTYVWVANDMAYEAKIGGTRYYVYLDSFGYWCLANQLNQTYQSGSIAHTTTAWTWGTLPPTSSWSGSGVIISSADDSEGGISVQGLTPDNHISSAGQALQVSFQGSIPNESASYLWQAATTPSFDSPMTIGTGSTYRIPGGEYPFWFRVIVTPTDSTGTVQGSAVASPPVNWP